ncbi:MAG: TonB-dependent receptor plug domain-containing protein [Sphingobium sp.]
MTSINHLKIKAFWLASAAGLAFAALPAQARAADAAPVPAADADTDAAAESTDTIVVTGRTATRSVTQVVGVEIQKALPGVSPLKALQTLPGVTFLTADPWGNNEQNISLFVHGFSASQLGYTLDGVPLGDQTYGNYNGLSPQRAIISENVGRVTLASGAGDLGTASTSNLGGTIDTFSSDPANEMGLKIAQTLGSYDASRTFVRFDSGTFGNGNSLYVSGLRQNARAWDFNGRQRGWQANGKFVHDDETGKLTAYFAYSDKQEPNEDATVIRPATPATAPYVYTRPFYYPDFGGMLAYLNSPAYTAAGDNYRNYYSAALRTDYLGYLKYDWKAGDGVTWSNQAYYHHNDGVGIVAGPITAAGLPQLFSYYFPGSGGSATSPENIARLSARFGGSGLATRTTEYRINRYGLLSTITAEIGNHNIEIGGWYERQRSSSYRRWYALDVNNPSNPYTPPIELADPLITQYGSEVRVTELQGHIQDAWKVLPTLTILAGFKATHQNAEQFMAVQPIPGSFTGSTELPNGRIKTTKGFLPQLGLLWEFDSRAQLFLNAQKNVRQFQTSAASGLSPFALGSQAAFERFKTNARPETSWTYEGGVRFNLPLNWGPLTGFEGQASYYHVDFSNRLLSISPNPAISAIVSGSPLIENVGDVKTDGVDLAGTLRFGPYFSFYNALSYNNSRYQDDYISGTTTVRTAGKKVPGSPDWLYKFIATANYDIFEVQLTGDYMGRRYATFTNDLSEKGYFTLNGRLGITFPVPPASAIKTALLSVNVTNITNKRAASTLSIGSASGTYNAFPLAPRQVFATLSLGF